MKKRRGYKMELPLIQSERQFPAVKDDFITKLCSFLLVNAVYEGHG